MDISQQVPLPPRSPRLPEKRMQSTRPDQQRQSSSSFRCGSNDSGDVDRTIQKAHHSADEISFNGSLASVLSDKIQSAHYRDSKGRVSKSRRNLKAPDEKSDVPNPPNRKGSRSLHVSHSFFDFDGAKDKNFFIANAPASTPTVGSRKIKPNSNMETPAPKLEKKLSISSPAGVGEFPFITSPGAPNPPDDDRLGGASPASTRSAGTISAKYQREVERTAARLERLRRGRRASEETKEDLRVASH